MPRPPLHIRLAYWLSGRLNRIGDAWYRLIEPIERLFGYLMESVLGAFDSFEALESIVIRFVGMLLWPFIWIGRWFGHRMPIDSTGTGWLSLPQRTLYRLIAGVLTLAEKLNLDRVLFFFIWLLTPIWWPLATLLGFINAWLTTRQTREIALAIPALLLAAPFAYVAIAGTLQSQGQIAESYKRAVRDAVEIGDHNLVNLLERKLAQLGIDTNRTDYRTATSLADNGDLASAYERMKRLAPLDAQGYVAAHFWIAQRLLAGDLTATEDPAIKDESQRFLLAEQHLDRLHELEIAGPAISRMQAYVYVKTGRLREAVETLAPYKSESLEIASMRLRLLVSLKQFDGARDQAKTVLTLVEQRRRNKSHQDATDYEAYTLAAELVHDERQLEDFLNDWHAAEKTNPRPLELLATLRRRQVEQLLSSKTSNPSSVVEQLVEAVRLGSSPPWIATQLKKISSRRDDSHTAQLIWERLLASPDAPNQVLEMAATTAAGRGKIVDARKIFEQLMERGGDSATALNNYAWTLLQDPTPDPATALDTVNKALKISPTEHRFRETRGQVLIQLHQWSAAVEDFEYALNRMPDSTAIHSSLAECYEALGQSQLARVHRDRVSQ